MHSSAGDCSLLLDSDLVTHGWNVSIDPFPGESNKHFAMRSLRIAFLKKFHNFEKLHEADRKALELFTQVNRACSQFSILPCDSNLVAIAEGEARKFIYDFCYYGECQSSPILSLSSISRGFGVGPGANIGTSHSDFYNKLATSTMAATSSKLHDLYMHAISADPIWRGVESYRNRMMGREVVSGSRLSFVPKTTEISRTICTEPVLNMLFQKGIGNVLTERLAKVLGIDLSCQPEKNAILARIGSETGEFGTIDLSSASDSMSLPLVESWFPPEVVRWLKIARCERTTLPGGSTEELHMVSSMGNAFTFPLQTIFFSALVFGAYRAYDMELHRPFGHSLGNFAVFGDDIIVQRKAYNLVVELLTKSGFKVNKDKSFNEGLFRESCGHDYYNGYNVRGVYIKSFRDANDYYSAINRLNRWSSQHGILLHNTVSYLAKRVRFLPIPFDEMDDSGIKVPFSAVREKLPRDRNGSIRYRFSHVVPDQRWRVRDIDDWQRIAKARPGKGSPDLALCDVQAKPDVQGDAEDVGSDVRLEGRLLPRDEACEGLSNLCRTSDTLVARMGRGTTFLNPDGLLLAAIAGYLRDGYIVHRNNVRHAVIRRKVTPRWDPFGTTEAERLLGEHWKVHTLLNLGKI